MKVRILKVLNHEKAGRKFDHCPLLATSHYSPLTESSWAVSNLQDSGFGEYEVRQLVSQGQPFLEDSRSSLIYVFRHYCHRTASRPIARRTPLLTISGYS